MSGESVSVSSSLLSMSGAQLGCRWQLVVKQTLQVVMHDWTRGLPGWCPGLVLTGGPHDRQQPARLRCAADGHQQLLAAPLAPRLACIRRNA